MNVSECIEALQIVMDCMDDKLQGERDKITKLIDLKPSSFEYVLKSAINLLKMHTADAEQVRRGHWEKSFSGAENIKYCSECGGAAVMLRTFDYCPYCGAYMKGGAE